MAVTRMLSRVRDGLEATFESRQAPDDEIEFDASLEFITSHSEDDDAACNTQTIVNIWASLLMPEMGVGARSTVAVMVPVHLLEDEDEVCGVANTLWDSLQAHRQFASMESLDTEHPEGE